VSGRVQNGPMSRKKSATMTPHGSPAPVREAVAPHDDWRWEELDPVGLDDELLRMAGDAANEAGLRALDAIHLATALYLGLATVLHVTWDRRLAASAARLGLAVAPAGLA